MELNAYQKNYEFQERFWWFVGMRKIYSGILEGLGNKFTTGLVLDVGCGVGNNLNLFRNYGTPMGVDISNVPLQFCKKSGFDRCVQAEATELPFRSGVFPIVAALNVSEHVKNDTKLFQELERVCQKGGIVLIVTSAFPFLWGVHDEASHHYRRYRKSELLEKVRASGLYVERISYINMFGFHILSIIRPFKKMVSKFRANFVRNGRPKATARPQNLAGISKGAKAEVEIRKLPGFINWFLTKLLFLEAFTIKRINLPYGVSLLCLLRKK